MYLCMGAPILSLVFMLWHFQQLYCPLFRNQMVWEEKFNSKHRKKEKKVMQILIFNPEFNSKCQKLVCNWGRNGFSWANLTHSESLSILNKNPFVFLLKNWKKKSSFPIHRISKANARFFFVLLVILIDLFIKFPPFLMSEVEKRIFDFKRTNKCSRFEWIRSIFEHK